LAAAAYGGPQGALLAGVIKFAPLVWQEFIAAVNPNDFEGELKNAIAEFKKGNQIPLEELLKSNLAGLPSGQPNAVIVDSLPGVSELGERKSSSDLLGE